MAEPLVHTTAKKLTLAEDPTEDPYWSTACGLRLGEEELLLDGNPKNVTCPGCSK